jgi:hypothetical protein
MAKKMTGFEKQRILKTHTRRRNKPHGRRHAKKMTPKSGIRNKRGFYL